MGRRERRRKESPLPLFPSPSPFLGPDTQARSIDHFHYDVTRAKVSGSCSKDCAIARKCQKISINAISAKASYQVSVTKLCARFLDKFKEIQRGDFMFFFFDKRGIAKSVVNEHYNGKLFSKF